MEAHNPTTVEIKNRDAGAARARAPVVGAGEDGVMNEVVHRREGLRLDISFCGGDTGRDGSAARRKGRGRGGQEINTRREKKTREDGCQRPLLDATRYPPLETRDTAARS